MYNNELNLIYRVIIKALLLLLVQLILKAEHLYVRRYM